MRRRRVPRGHTLFPTLIATHSLPSHSNPGSPASSHAWPPTHEAVELELVRVASAARECDDDEDGAVRELSVRRWGGEAMGVGSIFPISIIQRRAHLDGHERLS